MDAGVRIAAPDLAVEVKLLNERHRLNFVDHLRLAMRFGDFAGYDEVDRAVPGEGLV
jgi:hypothetical protein